MKSAVDNAQGKPELLVIDNEILGGYPFKWNITTASVWIKENLNQVELWTVQVTPPSRGGDSENLDEELIPKANLTRPIIIVRMRPFASQG